MRIFLKPVKTFFSVLLLFVFVFFLIAPLPSLADDVRLQVPIGDVTITEEMMNSGTAIGEYIRGIYKYAIGTVGILAVVVMMFGGVLWITAGGNNERVTSAKAWIGAALSGLILAMFSYTILAFVNPALVNFRPLKVKKIDPTEIKPQISYITSDNKCGLGQSYNGTCFKCAWVGCLLTRCPEGYEKLHYSSGCDAGYFCCMPD